MTLEYKISWIGDPASNTYMVQDRLNELGAEDWQLICVSAGFGYFGREVQDEAGDPANA